MTNPYATAVPVPPKWARKRFVLPALALALLVGMGIGAGAGDDGAAASDAKPLAAEPRPTVTVTTTATATAEAAPRPATTVTATATVKVQVTKTVTAPAPANDDTASDEQGTSGGSGGADVYYANCTEARAAGATPLHPGDPGYDRHLDRDGDGSACE
ncbi:excalibur calcium-binding domain-containing protein [Streptomyces sp. NPDC006172]|uniref:excalibur calcium-binding domain-containing protein n=1 Tax=Streptomyces sp. NPDC006172 TaxID=3154470 RepID=UPI0033EF2E2F